MKSYPDMVGRSFTHSFAGSGCVPGGFRGRWSRFRTSGNHPTTNIQLAVACRIQLAPEPKPRAPRSVPALILQLFNHASDAVPVRQQEARVGGELSKIP